MNEGRHEGHGHVNAYDEETCEALMQLEDQIEPFGWAMKDANIPL